MYVQAPTIYRGDAGLYEEGEEGDERLRANLPKTLEALRIVHGTAVSCEDFSQDLKLTFHVFHKEIWDEKAHPDRVVFCAAGGIAT